MKAGTVLLAALLAITAVDAQIFRTAVDVVTADVLVLDGRRPVAGLTAADFELLDSDVPQKVQAVAMDDVPISLLVALDTSHSVEGARLKDAAHAAVNMLRPADRAAFVTFSGSVAIVAPWGADRDVMATGLSAARASGNTSLYDASFASLLLRDEKPGQRNLLVIFSDGADTASWLPDRAVLDKARRTDTVVYSVVMNNSGTVDSTPLHVDHRSGVELSPPPVRSLLSGTTFLADLATTSGGERFVVQRAGELRAAFSRIVTDFRSRYVLTYSPAGVDAKGWHPIEVKVNGRKVTVRARRGYTR
jgi:VWFA-related protein